MVNRPICWDCRSFVERVNSALNLEFTLFHRCLEQGCTICPT